jgi:penicillin amidase
MAAIHRDLETIPGKELRDRLTGVAATGPGAALRDLILGWDGRMDAASLGATAYNATRLALTKLVAARSRLAAAAQSPHARVAPGLVPENQLWWTVLGLLRADDVSLLGGATWDELLAEALAEAAKSPLGAWGEAHLPRLTHPLSSLFPAEAAALDRVSAPVGGDNDTVFATGCAASVGARAIYGSLSRYVFDVGAWENCRWIVFHGASGEPGDRWHMNQNAAWAAGEMVPMLYDWVNVTQQASAHQRLFFHGSDVYASGPEQALAGTEG